MAILWCGGEDIDFPVGAGPLTVSSSTGVRAGWSRCTLINNNSAPTSIQQSLPFPGGAVTSAWLHSRVFFYGASVSAGRTTAGVTLAGTTKGLFVGVDAATIGKAALVTLNGTTRVQLAVESGTSFVVNTSSRIDLRILNYGATATVEVYVNQVLVISYSGDVTVSGMTAFDTVSFGSGYGISSVHVSEFIVSDTDTRTIQGLVTGALTSNGTTNAWTNPTYTNINAAAVTDATPTYTPTPGQDNQYNITDMPAGAYAVLARKITMRAAAGPATATGIKMGYNSGGSIGFGAGASKAPGGAYGTHEQLDAVNPVTGLAWTQAEQNALQLNFRSE